MKKYFIIFILFSFPVVLFSQEDNKKALLEKKLSEMYETDQSIRKGLGEVNSEYAGKPELKGKMDSVISLMMKTDKENQLFISNLLDSEGWPSGLSFQANMAIFMIIQHAPRDYMNKYASMVEEEHNKGVIVPSLFAIFKDRLLMYAGKPQVYGSQTYNGYVWPIEDAENVDERRKEMQLPPMKDYLKIFENQSASVIWDKNMTVDDIKEKTKR